MAGERLMSDPLTDIACARCQDHGWTLDDQRVTPCTCPTGRELELPKWTRRDPACIVAHVTDPARPRRAAVGYLCAGCYGHLEWLIAEMPFRWAELASALAPASGAGGGKVSGTSEGRLPIVASENERYRIGPAADHRDEIVHTLASWAALLVEEHNERESAVHEARLTFWKSAYMACTTDEPRPVYRPIPAPRAIAVNVTATLLVAHLDWIARQPWVTDLRAEMQTLRSRAIVLLNPTRRRRVEIGLCGEDGCPGVLWIVTDLDGEGREMSCDYCRRTVEPRYWRKERKRIDGVDSNPWVTLDVAAAQYDVSVRTLQRWIAKGKLKARGEPTRVRMSAVEGVMRGLAACA